MRLDSKLDIVNQALFYLGQPKIASFNDPRVMDKGLEETYDFELTAMLCEHNWKFTHKVVKLKPTDKTVLPEGSKYKYAYFLPDEVLSVLEIKSTISNVEGLDPVRAIDYGVSVSFESFRTGRTVNEFEQVGDVLYSYIENPIVYYTERETDPSRFYPLFALALASSLASKLAYSFTENLSVEDRWFRRAEVALIKAKRYDSKLGEKLIIAEDTLLNARYRYYGVDTNTNRKK